MDESTNNQTEPTCEYCGSTSRAGHADECPLFAVPFSFKDGRRIPDANRRAMADLNEAFTDYWFTQYGIK